MMPPNTFAIASVSIPLLPWSPVGPADPPIGPSVPAATLSLFLSLQKAPQPLVDFTGGLPGGRPIVAKPLDRLDDLGDRMFDPLKLLFEFVSHRPS
jgi:hypothetical protein